MKQYYVYILSSYSRTLYIGLTSDLVRRVWEHKEKLVEGFSKRYHVNRLVYFESTMDVHSAIAREKQLKKWRREKKEILIHRMNPGWQDLYESILDSSTPAQNAVARNDR
ncbi:MAG: GIY-YIG nuclease family protein [Candidatus Omnitrophica bacterium]|nr:GIY-YIG nuclease family protein [Candidatus Omnitrophota bacterium]MDD5671827.1 GIY-YIG nuclease family protein [Candidatus Omnitrophota bacterium]